MAAEHVHHITKADQKSTTVDLHPTIVDVPTNSAPTITYPHLTITIQQPEKNPKSGCLKMSCTFFLETIVVLFKLLWFYVEAIYKYVAPTFLRTKKSLVGKKILITGSGSGIGRKMAIEFAKQGAILVLWDRNREDNEKTRELVEGLGAKVHTYQVDLMSFEQIDKISNLTKEEVGKIDILVNNAGVASGKGLFELSESTIDLSFGVNVRSHFRTLQNFLPPMLEANDGHIVTIASMAGKLATHGHPDYFSSKHAAVGLHDAVTTDVMKSGKSDVKTTIVCPYYIHTPMFDTRGAETKLPFLIPTLTADYVAFKVVEAVQLNSEVLVLPRVFYAFVLTLPMLPYKAAYLVGTFLGIVQDEDRFNRESNKNQ